MVFKAGEAFAPEMARALVAVVDFAGVCEVQAGDGWEFFCGGWWGGENCGAGADADAEDLSFVNQYMLEMLCGCITAWVRGSGSG